MIDLFQSFSRMSVSPVIDTVDVVRYAMGERI